MTDFSQPNQDPLQNPRVLKQLQDKIREQQMGEHEASVRDQQSQGRGVLDASGLGPKPDYAWRDNPLTPGAQVPVAQPMSLPKLGSAAHTRLFIQSVEREFQDFVAQADATHLQALATSGQLQEFQQQQMQELAEDDLDDEIAMFQQGLPMLFTGDRTAGGTQDPSGPISMQGPERQAYQDWAKSLYERLVGEGRNREANDLGMTFKSFHTLADALGSDEESIFQELTPRLDDSGDWLGDLLGGVSDMAAFHDEEGSMQGPWIDIGQIQKQMQPEVNEQRAKAGMPPMPRSRPRISDKAATRVGTLIRTAEAAFKDAVDYRFFDRTWDQTPRGQRGEEVSEGGYTAENLGRGAGDLADRKTYQEVLSRRVYSRMRKELKDRGLDSENSTEQFMRSMGSVLGLFVPYGKTGTVLKAGGTMAQGLTRKLLGKGSEEVFEGLGGKALEIATGSVGAAGALLATGYADGLTQDQVSRLDDLEQSGSSISREKVESEMRFRNGIRAAILGPISYVSGGIGPLASRLPGVIGRAAASGTKLAEQNTLKGFGARMFGEGVPFGVLEEAAAGGAEVIAKLSAGGDEELQRAMEMEFLAQPDLKNVAVELLRNPGPESIKAYAEQILPELAGLATIELVQMAARGAFGPPSAAPDQISALRRLVNSQVANTAGVDVGQMVRAAEEAHEALDQAEGPAHERAARRGLTEQVLADRDFASRFEGQDDAPADIREARLRIRAEMEEVGDGIEGEAEMDALEAEDNALQALENLDRWRAQQWFDRAEDIRDWIADGMEGEPPGGILPLMTADENTRRQMNDEAWLTSDEGSRFIEEGRYLRPAEARSDAYDEPIGPKQPVEPGPSLQEPSGRFEETFDADEIAFALDEHAEFREIEDEAIREEIKEQVARELLDEIDRQYPRSGWREVASRRGDLADGEWGIPPSELSGLESSEWGITGPRPDHAEALESQRKRREAKQAEKDAFEAQKARRSEELRRQNELRKDRDAGRARLNPDLRAEKQAQAERAYSYGRGEEIRDPDDYELALAQRSQDEFNERSGGPRAIQKAVQAVLQERGLIRREPGLVIEEKPVRDKTVSTIDGDIETARFGDPDSPQRAVEEAAEGRVPVEEVMARPDLPDQHVRPRAIDTSARSAFKGLEPLNEKGTALDEDLARYNEGDDDAVAELIGNLGPTLRKAARSAVRGDKRIDVDEVESDTTMKVWEALSSRKLKAETARDLERQVMTTAKNAARDMARSAKRRNALHGEMEAMSDEEGSSWQPAAPDARPEDVLAAEETAARESAMDPWSLSNVTRAMPHLTQKQREVVAEIVKGRENEEIAKELGIKPGTVKSRRNAAKKRIEKLMSEAGVGDLVTAAKMAGVEVRKAEGAEVIPPSVRTGPMKPVNSPANIEHAAEIASMLHEEIGNEELSPQELDRVFQMTLERAGETEEPMGLDARIEQLEQELSDAYDAGGAIGAREFSESLQPVLGGTVLGEILRYSPAGRSFIKRMEQLAEIDAMFSGAPIRWRGAPTPKVAGRGINLWDRFGWFMRQGAAEYTSSTVAQSRNKPLVPLNWRTPDTYAGAIHQLAMEHEAKADAALKTAMTQVYRRGESLFRPFKDDVESLNAMFDAIDNGPESKEWGDLTPEQAEVALAIRENQEAWRNIIVELHPQARHHKEILKLLGQDLDVQQQVASKAAERAEKIEEAEAGDKQLQSLIGVVEKLEAQYSEAFGKDKKKWPKDIQKKFGWGKTALKNYRETLDTESGSVARRNANRAEKRAEWLKNQMEEVEGWLRDFQEGWGLKDYILHRAADGSQEAWKGSVPIEYLNPSQMGTERSGDYLLTAERKRQEVRSKRLKKRGDKIDVLEKDVTKLWWEYVQQMTHWASVSEFTTEANEILYGELQSVGESLRSRNTGVLYRGGWFKRMHAPMRVSMKNGKPVEAGGKKGGRYVILMRGEKTPGIEQIKRKPSLLDDHNVTLVPVDEARISLREYSGGALAALERGLNGDEEAFDHIKSVIDTYAKTVGGEFNRRATGFAARQRRVAEARQRREALLEANQTRSPWASFSANARLASAHFRNVLEVSMERFATITTTMALSGPRNWMNILSGGLYANMLHGSLPGSRSLDVIDWVKRRQAAFEGADGTLPAPGMEGEKVSLTDFHERLRTPEAELDKLSPQERERRILMDDAFVAASKYGVWPTSVVDDSFAVAGSKGPWATPWSGMFDFVKSGLGVGWMLKHAEGYARWEGFVNDYLAARTMGEMGNADAETMAMALLHQKHVYYSRVTNPTHGPLGKNSPVAPLISGLNRYPIVKFMHAIDALAGQDKSARTRAWKATEVASGITVAWMVWNLLGVDLNMMIGGSGEDLVDDLGGEGNPLGKVAGDVHDTVQDLLTAGSEMVGAEGRQPVPTGVPIPTASPALKGAIQSLHSLYQAAVQGDMHKAAEHLSRVEQSVNPMTSSLMKSWARAFEQRDGKYVRPRGIVDRLAGIYPRMGYVMKHAGVPQLIYDLVPGEMSDLSSQFIEQNRRFREDRRVQEADRANASRARARIRQSMAEGTPLDQAGQEYVQHLVGKGTDVDMAVSSWERLVEDEMIQARMPSILRSLSRSGSAVQKWEGLVDVLSNPNFQVSEQDLNFWMATELPDGDFTPRLAQAIQKAMMLKDARYENDR